MSLGVCLPRQIHISCAYIVCLTTFKNLVSPSSLLFWAAPVCLQVVHGDLTTSNFMVRSGSEEVVAIDFGLASSQPLAEDKVPKCSKRTALLVQTGCDAMRSSEEV